MRVLLIKTSSMGDLIHTLPALTDAAQAMPNIIFDWVVEEPFAEIPSWHPHVDKIIPVALRQWRKEIFSKRTRSALKELRKTFRLQTYDMVLDAQGLVKSALVTYLAAGKRVGLDWKSAREPIASLAYQSTYKVNFYQHAIVRMRSLFSLALNYPLPKTEPQFALQREDLLDSTNEKYIVFLHGTTWNSKQWPEEYWLQLGNIVSANGYSIKIGGGNDAEVARANRIADGNPKVQVLPYMNIGGMAKLLANSQGVVAVDTGFGHLAAALDIPTVSLYSSTNPEFTGALGLNSIHLATKFACSPCLARDCHYKKTAEVSPACFSTLQPNFVWEQLQHLMVKPDNM